MPWDTLLSHETNISRFRHSVQQNRLASTYLFVGLPGIGKHLFASLLAEALLCENSVGVLEACGRCAACQQVQVRSHPDLLLISKPEDKAIIPVELFIGDKEHRRQQGLVHDIGLKPFRGGRRIAIVDDADCLNQEGANSLLKTLEEPPPKSVLILIGTSEQQQLQTIVSRSQIIRFEPLNSGQVSTILARQTEWESEIPLEVLSLAAEGSLRRAIQLSDGETWEYRRQLMGQLATGDPGQDNFGKSIKSFLDTAGKESAKKRERLVMIADFSISFFRHCYQQLLVPETETEVDHELHQASQSMLRNWNTFDAEAAAEMAGQAIERCLELQLHVHANVNSDNAVEAWLIDMGRICRGKALV